MALLITCYSILIVCMIWMNCALRDRLDDLERKLSYVETDINRLGNMLTSMRDADGNPFFDYHLGATGVAVTGAISVTGDGLTMVSEGGTMDEPLTKLADAISNLPLPETPDANVAEPSRTLPTLR